MRKNAVGNRFPANVPVISLGVASAVVVEGQTLTVNINRTTSALTSTCRFYTVPQSATDADFSEHNGTLVTFAPGETSKQVTVTIANDSANESDETFYVQIANPIMASIGNINKALVTITGQASPVGVQSVSSPSVTEGAPLVFNVVLTAPTNQPTLFSFNRSGTATASLDFSEPPTFTGGVTLNAGQITVPNGVSVFTVTYPTIDDVLVESAETVILNIGGLQGTGTINSDDTAIANVFSQGNVLEGSPLVFDVTLSAPSSQSRSFPYSRSGTAAAGADFTDAPTFSNGVVLSGGQVTIPAGVTAFTVTFPTINDTADEPQETIILTIGGVSGTGIILSDDGLLAAFSMRLIEMPYYMLTTGQRSGLAANDGYIAALVERNITGLATPTFNLRKSTDNVTFTAISDANYAPTGYLYSDVSKTVEAFPFVSAVDMADVVYSGNKVIGFIDDEIVEVVSNVTSGGIITGINVRRGVLDTVPQAHDVGAKIYIAVTNIGKDPTEYVSGNQRYYKALPKSAGGAVFTEADAASSNITLGGRASRPYPPNMFKVNGSYYPPSVTEGDITISWQNRNRITQITDLIDYNDATSSSMGTVELTNNAGSIYTDVADSKMVEYSATTNYGSAPDLNVAYYERSVIRFGNLSDSAFDGQTVVSANLSVELIESDTTYELHIARLLKPFVEGEVTWNNASTGTPWASGGAEGGADIHLASKVTFTEADAITEDRLVINGLGPMVQAMIDGNNYGFLLANIAAAGSGFIVFGGKEMTETDLRPILTVEFAAGDSEAEAGTTYTVQFYDGDTMIREVTGIDDNQYVYTNANQIADGDPDALRVKLFSVRDGLPSLTAHEHAFSRPFTGVPTPTAISISGGVEGSNAVFTVTMSGSYHDWVDHPFTLTGNYQPADIGTITYSNGVEDGGDGTFHVPAAVSSFTVTIPILTDALAETGENITLTMSGGITNTINLTNP